jgi:ABC-type Fe3+-hydroxamate transport system substrate-binding protein
VHSRLAPWPYWRHVPAWKNGKCYVLKSCPVGVQDSWGHTF